jgi:hypothetical protein
VVSDMVRLGTRGLRSSAAGVRLLNSEFWILDSES